VGDKQSKNTLGAVCDVETLKSTCKRVNE